VTAEVAVARFTMGDLMSLEVNSVIATRTPTSADILVGVNGELVARAEMDAVGDRIAVRIAEVA